MKAKFPNDKGDPVQWKGWSDHFKKVSEECELGPTHDDTKDSLDDMLLLRHHFG